MLLNLPLKMTLVLDSMLHKKKKRKRKYHLKRANLVLINLKFSKNKKKIRASVLILALILELVKLLKRRMPKQVRFLIYKKKNNKSLFSMLNLVILTFNKTSLKKKRVNHLDSILAGL